MESRRLGGCIVHIIAAETAALHITALCYAGELARALKTSASPVPCAGIFMWNNLGNYHISSLVTTSHNEVVVFISKRRR